MKICQIMAGRGNGGLEKHTMELSNLLKEKGIDVTVIAHPEFGMQLKNVKFIPLDLTKSRNNIFVLFKLYKILKKEKFDIIHTQANKATSMVVKLRPFLTSKIVATLHNIKSSLNLFKKVDYVITVSNKIGLKLNIKNKITIYNGINFDNSDLEMDLYNKFNIKNNKFIICSIARFTKVKRFDILLKSIKNLDIHLVLVGSGKEEGALHKLAKELEIEEKITFTGVLSNEEAKKVLASSKLFVMTSDNEGFPYTFVESMFCRTPFLSTPVSDVSEFIGEKYTIPFSDVRETSKRIEYIKNNYQEVLNDFKIIFDKFEKQFTLDNMVNETITIYKNVMN